MKFWKSKRYTILEPHTQKVMQENNINKLIILLASLHMHFTVKPGTIISLIIISFMNKMSYDHSHFPGLIQTLQIISGRVKLGPKPLL